MVMLILAFRIQKPWINLQTKGILITMLEDPLIHLQVLLMPCAASIHTNACKHACTSMTPTSFEYTVTEQFHKVSIETSVLTTLDECFPGAL